MTRVSTVLVVDPQAASRAETVRLLQGAGLKVAGTGLGEDLARALDADRPAVTVLELGEAGVERVRAVRKITNDDSNFCPILVIVPRPDPGLRIDILDAGGDDALSRPFEPRELAARVGAHLRTSRFMDGVLRGRAEAEESATHDPLTGLHNQRYLTSRLPEEFRRAQRYQEPLSLLKIDVDHLEQVNGRFGRGAGDRVLAACARTITTTCREVDIVTRAGGDEFVVLLPNTHFAGSLAIAERLVEELGAADLDLPAGAATLRVSVGAASFPGREISSPKDLLRWADGALRRAKAEGPGHICLYQHHGYLLEPEAA